MELSSSFQNFNRVQFSICYPGDGMFVMGCLGKQETQEEGTTLINNTLISNNEGTLPEINVSMVNGGVSNETLNSVTEMQEMLTRAASEFSHILPPKNLETKCLGASSYGNICGNNSNGDILNLADSNFGSIFSNNEQIQLDNVTRSENQSAVMETVGRDEVEKQLSSCETEKFDFNGISSSGNVNSKTRRGRGRPPGSKNRPKNILSAVEKSGIRSLGPRGPHRITRRQVKLLNSNACTENFQNKASCERLKKTSTDRCVKDNPLTEKRSLWIAPACAKMLMESVKVTDVTADSVTVTFKECSSEAGFFHTCQG